MCVSECACEGAHACALEAAGSRCGLACGRAHIFACMIYHI